MTEAELRKINTSGFLARYFKYMLIIAPIWFILYYINITGKGDELDQIILLILFLPAIFKEIKIRRDRKKLGLSAFSNISEEVKQIIADWEFDDEE